MPDQPIISVEGLGKRYTLGSRSNHRYTALRDVIAKKASNLFRHRPLAERAAVAGEFWALKDVSFSVKRGDVVGIIGRNGAGKSTLLKLLSRISEPTAGSIRLRGRVASLLEVGTGFHPELTGRENIYLNGAILGMRRAEIKARFDEIVAFAEVERFLDTPVKRYSSGMYVRLAFAVAAHLNPEILIVDEVLAVGDADFQKKCLGKMQNVARGEGRTVLFVSHNMGAVRKLCNQGLLLAAGKSSGLSEIEEAISRYNQAPSANPEAGSKPELRFIHEVTLENAAGEPIAHLFFGEMLRLRVKLRNLPLCSCALNVAFRSESGETISLFSTEPHDGVRMPRREEIDVTFTMPEVRFAPSGYEVEVALTEPGVQIIETMNAVLRFDLSPQPLHGVWTYDRRFGQFFPNHQWTVDNVTYQR